MYELKFYNDFIKESKQVGIIYHFTLLENLFSILDKNAIFGSSGEFGGLYISCTRNNKLNHKTLYGITGTGVRITLDGNKLSEKYKIEPYKYGKENVEDESEERIFTNKITNIIKYIKEIDIFYDIAWYDEIRHWKDFNRQQIMLSRYFKNKEYITFDDVLIYLKEVYPQVKINVKRK